MAAWLRCYAQVQTCKGGSAVSGTQGDSGRERLFLRAFLTTAYSGVSLEAASQGPRSGLRAGAGEGAVL